MQNSMGGGLLLRCRWEDITSRICHRMCLLRCVRSEVVSLSHTEIPLQAFTSSLLSIRTLHTTSRPSTM